MPANTIQLAHAESMSPENLLKAGVEIKLSRAELADYITTRMQAAAQKEMIAMHDEILDPSAGKTIPKPKSLSLSECSQYRFMLPLDCDVIAGVMSAFRAMNPNLVYQVWVHYWTGDKKPVVHMTASDSQPVGAQIMHMYFGRGHASVPVEIEALPTDIQEKIKKADRIYALAELVERADKKKYRAEMVKVMLNSTEAGVALQAEIDAMLKSAIKNK